MVEEKSLNNTDFVVQKPIVGGTQRIEYIDAMRGFTILLVVINHVATFDFGLFGNECFSYSQIFGEFRMPLFFFVSGFVFYKEEVVWSYINIFNFLKKKSTVQILSPLLFLFIFCWCYKLNIKDALYDYQKQGYWFTFTLFTYFLLYIIVNKCFKALKIKRYVDDVLLVSIGFCVYGATVYSIVEKCELDKGGYSLLGIPTLHNFLFFLIGTRVKRYFHIFEKLLDDSLLVFLSLVTFFILLVVSEIELLSSSGYHLFFALTGIVITFAFFRTNRKIFSKEKCFGRVSQYVGRRTLDIYLLHYFFIFSNMQQLLPNFGILNSPFLEFWCSLIVSILVIANCLFISEVIRLSPLLAHFLFGQKLPQR